jgi:hypothetical protein
MTLQGAVTFLSLFGPPLFGLFIFRRMGRPWLKAFVDSLYIFAVCMMVLLGLLIVHSALGVFGESVLFALPFLVVICLWFLMARHPNARN